MVKGLKNAYLMHFSSLHSWFHCRGCYYLKCSSSLSQSLCKGQIKGQKTFFGQNSFQLMYNHKPKSNAPLRKNHKTADRKGVGGGQPLTVSLTVKYPLFFLTTSLSDCCATVQMSLFRPSAWQKHCQRHNGPRVLKLKLELYQLI